MAEENSAKIVADKNKTPDQYIQEAEEFYIVPDLIRDEFPDLIKLIFETESMDQEEREYWLQIMPIMDKEQIEKFRGILVNEQQQLQEIEQSGPAGGVDVPKAPVITEEEMKRKMREIAEKEKAHEEQEVAKEEELLKSLEGL